MSLSAIKSSVRSRVRKDNLEEYEESDDEEEEEEEEEDSKKIKVFNMYYYTWTNTCTYTL